MFIAPRFPAPLNSLNKWHLRLRDIEGTKVPTRSAVRTSKLNKDASAHSLGFFLLERRAAAAVPPRPLSRHESKVRVESHQGKVCRKKPTGSLQTPPLSLACAIRSFLFFSFTFPWKKKSEDDVFVISWSLKCVFLCFVLVWVFSFFCFFLANVSTNVIRSFFYDAITPKKKAFVRRKLMKRRRTCCVW